MLKALDIDCASTDISSMNQPCQLMIYSPTQEVRRQGTSRKYIHQFNSDQDIDENSTANLRDLIAAAGLVILPKSDPIRRFFDP